MRTRGQFLDALRLAVRDAIKAPNATEQMERVRRSKDVLHAQATFGGEQLARLNAILASDTASDSTTTSPEELADVVIAGEAKMAAG